MRTTLVEEQRRDRDTDGTFVFALVATGIYCRSSCCTRHPLQQNIRFFSDTATVQEADFRPCKRCQPEKMHPQAAPAHIEKTCRLLESCDKPIILRALAHHVALSHYHLHRLFKATTGLTPKTWQQERRAGLMPEALHAWLDLTQALYSASTAAYVCPGLLPVW